MMSIMNNEGHVVIKILFSPVSSLGQRFDIKYVHYPVCGVFVVSDKAS